MIKLILPEAPPSLSAEEMDLLPPTVLKAEEDRRYDLLKQLEKCTATFQQSWLLVYRHQKAKAAKAAIRAEVLAELKAGMTSQTP